MSEDRKDEMEDREFLQEEKDEIEETKGQLEIEKKSLQKEKKSLQKEMARYISSTFKIFDLNRSFFSDFESVSNIMNSQLRSDLEVIRNEIKKFVNVIYVCNKLGNDFKTSPEIKPVYNYCVRSVNQLIN